jgi:selenide,water dikinase
LKTEEEKLILCDPQTSGGLLIAVEESALHQVLDLLKENDIHTQPFGRLVKRGNALITVV